MLRVEISTDIHDTVSPIDRVIQKYSLNTNDIQSIRIHHRALDARVNRPACFQYQIDIELNNEARYIKRFKGKARQMVPYHYEAPVSGIAKLAHRPVVVGFGPAGMFSALLLAEQGYRPLVIERGPAIEERQQKVSSYWSGNALDTEGNVQFGEGGAGAFSDGKLTTRVKDPRVSFITDKLIEHGADPSIAWMNHPHVGTDVFCKIDVSIRKKIEELGGEVRFNTKLTNLIVENEKIRGIEINGSEILPAECVILAVGHSARDTFHVLHETNMDLASKQFAVGVRVEHLQSFINDWQYRNISDDSVLPPSEYHLTHTSSLKKGVYSFCMCPGGYVVASTSVKDTIVTNGMSYSKRDGTNANAAILVQVDQNDFGDGLFDGVAFQENMEHMSYRLGNGKAPAQMIRNYLGKGSNTIGNIQPTYSLGVEFTDLHSLFSDPLNTSLTEFFEHTETLIPGFSYGDAIMTGVETRTSSPIRMIRDFNTLQSNIQGVYPAGEGAGYAGGIVSSAIDGVKCAEQIIAQYHN